MLPFLASPTKAAVRSGSGRLSETVASAPRSCNDSRARSFRPAPEVNDGARWARLLENTDAFGDPEATRRSGRIDLAQAWRVGGELAGRRRFSLVELVRMPERTAQQVTTDLFRSSLAEREDRQFRQLGWRALTGTLQPPWPEWLERWAAARRIKPAGQRV